MIRKNDDFVYLSYHDNGPGYQDSILNSIDTLESYGLFIIKTLAVQLNGQIHLSNYNGAKIEININTNSNALMSIDEENE